MSEERKYLENFSYVFIPVSFLNPQDFAKFDLALKEDGDWMTIKDQIQYMHKFVSDKLVNENTQERKSYHYRLDKKAAQKAGIYIDEKWYSTGAKTYMGQENIKFRFLISDVQLFCFSTTVCILAMQIRFEDNDPKKIAAAQYYLRKISTEKLYIDDVQQEYIPQTFVDMAKKLFGNYQEEFCLDFFFYASPGYERANFLTYVDVPEKESYQEELYYLKWCYHEGFVYDEITDLNDSENYVASSNITWGISPSAAVCFVCRKESEKAFIEKTFQKNFMNQYLFTYILLLHQKYVMYLMLTKIGDGMNNNLELLENYKRRLYEFETDFVFSRISEVPQYQRLYEKISRVFGLKEMFYDVQEPLSRLAEIQHQCAEEEQNKYDKQINTVLTTLSFLTIFSAIADAAGITANLGWLVPSWLSKIIQVVMIAGVIGLSIFMVIRLIRLRKKR